jgi:hypothetical protein
LTDGGAGLSAARAVVRLRVMTASAARSAAVFLGMFMSFPFGGVDF